MHQLIFTHPENNSVHIQKQHVQLVITILENGHLPKVILKREACHPYEILLERSQFTRIPVSLNVLSVVRLFGLYIKKF